MASFSTYERRDLVRNHLICGRGIGEGFRPCREVSSHNYELCFRHLVLFGDAYILNGDFGVRLRVLPRLGSMELFVKLVALGLFREQFRLQEVEGGGLACVGAMGVSYFGSQDLISCASILLFIGRLLGTFVDLEEASVHD